MKTLRLLVFATGIALFFAGCAGKDGAPGATGPQGPQGNQGAPGNATTYDQTYSVSSWTWTASPGYWWVQISDADVTSSILNTGSVQVFVSYNSGTSWNNIPYTEVISSGLTGIWTVNEALGIVQVNYTYSDQAAHNDPNTEYSTANMYFKVLCITGPIMKKHPGTNWTNYAEVEKVLSEERGLPLHN